MKCIIFGSNPNTIALVFRFSFLFDGLLFVRLSICYLLEMDVVFAFAPHRTLFAAFFRRSHKHTTKSQISLSPSNYCRCLFALFSSFLPRSMCVCVCLVLLCDDFPLWRRRQRWWLLFAVCVMLRSSFKLLFIQLSNRWQTSCYIKRMEHGERKKQTNVIHTDTERWWHGKRTMQILMKLSNWASTQILIQ